MLDLALTDVVQVRSPFRVVLKVFGDVFRKKNVPGVSAIHYPLRNINPGSRYVRALIYIGDLVNRSAVDAHSNLELRVFLKRLTNLQSAAHRLFRAVSKDQSHPVTCR